MAPHAHCVKRCLMVAAVVVGGYIAFWILRPILEVAVPIGEAIGNSKFGE
jgi:hypothetical protein